jgi:hypothetical protein
VRDFVRQHRGEFILGPDHCDQSNIDADISAWRGKGVNRAILDEVETVVTHTPIHRRQQRIANI